MTGLRSLFLCFLLLAAVSGCKDPNELGLDILPDSDELATGTDTLTVLTRTVVEDSLRSDELSAQLIGNYVDPYFGKANAEVFTEVLLQGTPSFSSLLTADSLILRILYKGYYGDTNTTQTIRINRLTQSMNADSVYYTSTTFAYDPALIGSLTFQPRPNTRVVIDSDTIAPQLRIPMDMSLADTLISLSGTDTVQSNTAWREYFKGLRLSIDEVFGTNQGCINYVDLFNSRMTLYYHDTDSVARNYSWVLTGAKSNHFTHDYTSFPVGNHLQDSTYADSLTCIQAMAGVKTRIDIPYLRDFADSNKVVINRAELKVTLQEGSYGMYPAPSSLLLVAIDSAGTTTSFPVDYYEPSGFFGGGLSTATYTFRLTRHVNRILSGAMGNYGYYLVVSGSSIQASRAIVGSGKNQAYPIKLNLYYTRIP